jgi:nitrous oxidase accessory protein NosD
MIEKTIWLVALLFLMLPLGCSAAGSKAYYVSLTGRDTNDGLSQQTAFRTVQKGAQVAQAGDTVVIAAGDYGSEQVTVANSGKPGAPIVLKAAAPGEVVLRGTGGGAGISIINKSHVVAEGIEFTNYSSGVSIKYASPYITVRNCVFRNNNSSGILVYGNFKNPGDCHDILLAENQFLDYAETGPGSPTNGSGIQDYGMCLYAATRLEAVSNYFYGHHHQALSFKKLVRDSRAANNVFEGFYYSAIYLGQNDDSVEEGYLRSERLIAEGNVFRPTQEYRAKRAVCVANVSDAIVRNNFVDSVYGGDGEGCIAVHPISTGAKVYGNLIVSERGGGQPALYLEADCEVYNNTFVDCNLALQVASGCAPVLRNNLFSRNKTQVKFSPAPHYKGDEEHRTRRFPDGKVWTWQADPAKSPVFERNCWFPDWSGKGATDISVEPRLVGPFAELPLGELSPKFVPDFARAKAYHLAKGSPCIDKGVEVGLPYVGVAPDLGAFESGPGRR